VAGRASNNEGSLYQRSSDGLWVGAITLGYDDQGHAKRKTVSAKTRAAARKKLQALQRTIDDGLPPPDDRLTVADLLDLWLKDVVPLRVTASTLANYTSVVDNHIKPALGRKRLSKLTDDDVQRFIRIKLDDGLSTRTVRLLRSTLVQVLNFAVSRGRVPRNVAALTQGPKLTAHKESRDLSVDEAKILIKALEGERLEALYLLRLISGMRPGEGFGLHWSHLDLESGTVRVSQALSRQPGGNVIADGKTHRKGWRTVPLAPPVVEALRLHKERQDKERSSLGEAWQENGLVFCTPIGTPLDPDNERKAFYAVLERAGLGHLTPNELRHSAASIMLAQGVPLEVVSEILGHTSIRITKDVYGHIGEGQRRGAADAIAGALWT